MRQKCLFWLAAALPVGLLLVIACASARAENQTEIVDAVVTTTDSSLRVSFRVQDCFTPKMEEAILSGVETTFKFLVVLEKPGFPLAREKLVDVSFDHTIKYDRLKNEFVVELEEELQAVKTTSNFDEAKTWMSEVNGLPLIPLWRLDKEIQYQLALKAELSKVRLPLFFRYIFFFVSLWDFQTDWLRITISL